VIWPLVKPSRTFQAVCAYWLTSSDGSNAKARSTPASTMPSATTSRTRRCAIATAASSYRICLWPLPDSFWRKAASRWPEVLGFKGSARCCFSPNRPTRYSRWYREHRLVAYGDDRTHELLQVVPRARRSCTPDTLCALWLMFQLWLTSSASVVMALHGDERGSTDRLQNQYGSPFLPQDEDWRRQDQRLMKQPPVALSIEQRNLVERAIRNTCMIRQWNPLAVNVRTNHVHAVVSCNGTRPELVLNALKSNATRTLREQGYWKSPHSPWSDHGSRRYLWSEQGVQQAIDYVMNRQD